MTRESTPTARRLSPSLLLFTIIALVLVVAGLIGFHSWDVSTVSSAPTGAKAPSVMDVLPRSSSREHAIGVADGEVPEGVTVFDSRYPAVTKLDPALLTALRRAATDAAQFGITFVVDSGWRSVAYQQQLLNEATSKYGSAKEAARWVATPSTSAHVTGDAIDIGPSRAATWLARNGGRYGLCQIYKNEAWHFERRPQAISVGCPSMYADPTFDPRMQP